MRSDLMTTSIWILLKAVMMESILFFLILSIDENIFVALGFAVLASIFAAVISVPLLLLVYPIVKFALSLPYSFRAQMVWLNFATAISITTLLFLFFELSLGSIEGTFILFLVSIFASISFGCWTSKNALRKFRLIFCKYVDHGENQNTSIE